MKTAGFWRRGMALLGDGCGCYLLTMAWLCLFKPPFRLCVMEWMMVMGGICHVICFIFLRRSLFQYLMRIRIQGSTGKYCFYKTLLYSIVPFAASRCHPFLTNYVWQRDLTLYAWEYACARHEWLQANNAVLCCCLACLIPLLLAECICHITQKQNVCEKLSGSRIMLETTPKAVAPKLVLLLVLLLPAIGKPVYKWKLEKENFSDAYNSLVSFPPIPLWEQLKYARSFEANAKKPERIMDEMFEKFDIVVFSERHHPEYTQWDFLSQYILNERFAQKIGNISTEYGRLDQQQALEHFLLTDYGNDSLTEAAAADLVRTCIAWWPIFTNRNLFDFMLRFHNYNITHDSTLQIRWNFSNHDAFLEQSTDVWAAEKAADSIMGVNMVNHYRRQIAKDPSRNKLLVILNNVHGYREITSDKKAIDYLEEAFPGKVGVVYLTTDCRCTFMLSLPTAMGLWDEAAKKVGYPFGVFVKDCILKDELYDGWQAPEKRGHKKVGDLFDAVLFLNHPLQQYWRQDGFPFMFKDDEENFVRRCKQADMEKYIVMLEEYQRNGRLPNNPHPPLLKTYNMVYDCCYYLCLLIPLICLMEGLCHSLYCQRKQKKQILQTKHDMINMEQKT